MEIILSVLLVLVFIIVVVNYIALRNVKSEIRNIKNDLSFVGKNVDENAAVSIQDTMNSTYESLLSEIREVGNKVDEKSGEDNPDIDDLYEEAKEIVIEEGKCSTSFLQRRLRTGYSRAARLMDMLEDNGIIGPQDGAKPREVLVKE